MLAEVTGTRPAGDRVALAKVLALGTVGQAASRAADLAEAGTAARVGNVSTAATGRGGQGDAKMSGKDRCRSARPACIAGVLHRFAQVAARCSQRVIVLRDRPVIRAIPEMLFPSTRMVATWSKSSGEQRRLK